MAAIEVMAERLDGAIKMSDEQQPMLPSLSGWYGPTDPGSRVEIMDGARPRLMETKPLLVGEWPPKTGEGPHGPLSARPAWVLCAILGVTYETFLCLFDRVNLLKHWAGEKSPRMSTLKVMAEGFEFRGDPVIFLGRRVCDAVGFVRPNYNWEEPGPLDRPWRVAVPHPSGRNLKYNEGNERAMVKAVLERSLLYHGRLFRVGDYPNGNGSMVMLQTGTPWGDAERRLRHRSKRERG
ncbi:MAG: hypothetical protein GY769_08000 [bacterium]|nr:hypothetical protein [bacterium]